MPVLNHYVDPTANGRFGILNTLAQGDTFGSYGAGPCVILLVKLADNTFFCGHMSCGWRGDQTTKATVTAAVNELLTSAVKVENKNRPWAYTTGLSDVTSKWMRDAMIAWFTQAADPVSSSGLTDGYFDANGNFKVSGNITGGTNRVDNGAFHIGPA